MRRFVSIFLLAAIIFCPFVPSAHAYTLQYTSPSATTQLRWPTNTINIALSTSLQSPPANIKPGSDVVGAARRALARWSEAANIQFNITFSDSQAITPSGGADNESLITVSTASAGDFQPGVERPGIARIFFEPNTGATAQILAGDIAINPFLQFSTDGSPDTYDLESTFVHELGHVLGLEHSAVLGASMMPRQGKNITTYNMPAQTVRTLSDDDRAGMLAIYGPRAGLGAIEGTVATGTGPIFGAHVWAEDVATGRVRASNITLPNGSFRIEGLPPGQYRIITEPLDEPVAQREIPTRSRGAYGGLITAPIAPFRTAERSDIINVAANATANGSINFSLTAAPTINATLIGTNGILSTVPVPLVPGRTLNLLLGGEQIHQVGASGITVPSPFITVDQSSYQQMFFGSLQVISVNVNVAATAPPGDYSLRLQATTGQSTGEIAYISGGLTIDLPNGTTATDSNLIDDSQFFVAQHYRDFLNREADASGLAFWTNQITECGDNAACREVRRVNVSAAFFVSIEFQETGYLVYRFYDAAFNRFPRFREFLPDTQRIGRGVIVNVGNWQQQLETNKQAFANEFVARPQFLAQYPENLSPEEFVDRLNANTDAALSPVERNTLVNGLRNGTETRATVLRRVAEDADLQRREFNRAFVLIQYFGYLRRNPDDAPDADFSGYNFWLNKLNAAGGDYVKAEMIKAFLTSPEYRRRFRAS
ncbi:MAG TPA: DUF4214 domain-containing protein [Pyrinomonadaceae bacterium]|jgi:hypothetical protein